MSQSFNIQQLLKGDFVSSMLFIFIILICIIFFGYLIYLNNLQSRECSMMNSIYGAVNGKIKSINILDTEQFGGKLNEYYINTAYNCCSGGSYKNDFVNTCNLKNIIKSGVRCLDFEIYSVNNEPVIATSIYKDNYYIKETYNSVAFKNAMEIINIYAFSGNTSPNYKDPIIIHLRIKSNNQTIYSKMAEIFNSYDNKMLGSNYSFQNYNKNIGNEPLINFMGKYIIIVNSLNNTYLQNPQFLEYVNITSNSLFMRGYNFDSIKHNPDTQELTEYNKQNMTIVTPNIGINPPNPNAILCGEYGCQFVAMRYQLIDNKLEQNISLFNDYGHAFVLKPKNLRHRSVTNKKTID